MKTGKIIARLLSVKKYLLFGVASLVLCACTNSGSSASSTQTSNNHLIDPAAHGNGVWNYSVATDYFYGTQSPVESPSLKYDLQHYTTTATQFVFPDMGYLTGEGSNSSYSISCAPSTAVDFNYYANPQVKADANLGTAGIAAYLGNCVDGESVTGYYRGFISHVVPVVEYDSSFLALATTHATSTMMQIADTVAGVINRDPNAYGVAFDNEPSINSQVGTTQADIATGAANELAFFGELAYKLAESNKYLFLFDANATAISLYENGYTISNTVYKLNNIVLMQPLYDLESTGAYPSGPLALESYSKDAGHQANSDLNPSNDSEPPLMFVLPASSTSTIWDYLQGYNMVSSESPYVNPTTLNNAASCQTTDATTVGTIDNGVLGIYLCSAGADCPGGIPNIYIESYLSTANCVNYANNQVMDDYFSSALELVESAATQTGGTTSNRYLGSTLYAWRIPGYNDIACSASYYNVLDTSSLYKLCTQQFPAVISPTVWNSYNTWGWPN